eukprot:1160088-Pelagomonas_calceolata.AAC.3
MKQTGETLHAGSKHTVVYSKGMERTSCTGVSLPTSNILGPCISSKRTAQAMLALLHMSSLQSGISLTCNVPAKGFIPARLERRCAVPLFGGGPSTGHDVSENKCKTGVQRVCACTLVCCSNASMCCIEHRSAFVGALRPKHGVQEVDAAIFTAFFGRAVMVQSLPFDVYSMAQATIKSGMFRLQAPGPCFVRKR